MKKTIIIFFVHGSLIVISIVWARSLTIRSKNSVCSGIRYGFNSYNQDF